MQNDELLHKWIEGTISEEELKIFALRPEYQSLVNLNKHTQDLKVPVLNEQEMLAEILQQPNTEEIAPPKARRTFLSNRLKYAAAAALILLAGVFLWPNNNQVSYAVEHGNTQKGTLPDQSTFVLNAGSTLSYDKDRWENSRTLDLIGEAYFEVQKGAVFSVKTPEGEVRVLGTHFNVKVRKSILEVSCQEGRVAVIKNNKQEILNANEALRFVDNQLTEKWELDGSTSAAWVDGIFKFRKMPLHEVLAALERQFDIKIKSKNMPMNEIISCNFQKDNLEMALKTSLNPLGIKYRKVSEKVIELYK